MARNNPRPQTIGGTTGDDLLIASLDRPTTIFGRAGNDTLRGSLLSDTLDGGTGNDTLFDSANDGRIGIFDSAADTLLGGAGDDRLFSTGGADFLDGGTGLDFADVSSRSVFTAITSIGSLGEGGTLTLSTGARITNVETLVLTLARGDDNIATGASADTVRGAAGNDSIRTLGGNDSLFGDVGNDTLDGGAGSDRLLGGGGNDVLIGGTGADVFVFDQFGDRDGFGVFPTELLGPGLDRILDFNLTEGDRLDARFLTEFGDGGQAIVANPFALGFARLRDTAEGALVEVVIDRQGTFAADGSFDGQGTFAPSILFVGVSVAELGTDFLI